MLAHWMYCKFLYLFFFNLTCKNSLLELNYSSLIGRPVFATLKIKMNFLFFVIFEFESLIFTFNNEFSLFSVLLGDIWNICYSITFLCDSKYLSMSVFALRYTSIFFCSSNIEPVEPIPTATGQEVVTSLSQGILQLQNRKIRVNTLTPTANLENSFNLTSCLCMSLRGWLESLERTLTDKRRTCNLYAEKAPGWSQTQDLLPVRRQH